MAQPYPIELRERAVAVYESGAGSYEEVADDFSIGKATLERWVKRKRDTGSVEPDPPGGGNHSPVDLRKLEAVISGHPDGSTYELTAAYNRRVARKDRVHRSSIQRALVRADYVFKKNGLVRQS